MLGRQLQGLSVAAQKSVLDIWRLQCDERLATDMMRQIIPDVVGGSKLHPTPDGVMERIGKKARELDETVERGKVRVRRR